MENQFYVYLHTDSLGEIFYIGKGCKRRAKSLGQRSKDWKEKAKNGFTVSYAATNLTEEDAFDLEKKLIAYFLPLGKLVNIYSGGGPVGQSMLRTGRKISDEHKQKLTYANKNYDPEKYRKSSETLAIREYITPAGKFHSLRLAAEANQCAVMTVRNRCHGFIAKRGEKKYNVPPKNGWSFVEKE